MIFEICGDSVEAIELAQKYGAKRIELCSALSVGGLTPSRGLVERCVEIAGVEVHAMIRHKEGDFVYSSSDIEIMIRDIICLKAAGVHGIVFGCLTTENQIDVNQNKRLFTTAKDLELEVTFHRAFDFSTDKLQSLEQLIEIGFDRLLTSGGEKTAEEGLPMLAQLAKNSNERIQIMAGSGVNANNAIKISETGIDALHFTSHRKVDMKKGMGMGSQSVIDQYKAKSIIEQFATQ